MKKILSLGLALIFLLGTIQNTRANDSRKTEIQEFLKELQLEECLNYNPRAKNDPHLKVTAAELYCYGMKSIGLKEQDLPRLIEIRNAELNKNVPRSLLKYYIQIQKMGLELPIPPTDEVGTAESLRFLLQSQGFVIPRIPNTKKQIFIDISPKDENLTAVEKALELNIIKPEGEKKLGLKAQINRAELLNILFKLSLIHDQERQLFQPVEKDEPKPRKSIIPNGDILQEIAEQISERYLYQDRVDTKKAFYEAIKTFVNHLKDKHTVFFDPEENKSFQSDLQGKLEGIGAYIDQEGKKTVIISPIQGSPADKGGLKARDIILKVNGESVEGLAIKSVVEKIKGPAGTDVTLSIDRNGNIFDVIITRAKIVVPAVTVTYPKENIPLIKLTQFNVVALNQMKKTLEELKSKEELGIIVDVRNNPGGFLHIVLQMLEFFVNGDTPLVKTISNNGEVLTLADDNRKIIPETWKLVILTNKGSASASEIFAATIKEQTEGVIVGETTYGKGTVQELRDFMDNSSFKMTIAEWKSGIGTKIDGIGVIPDIEIADDPSTEKDEQLEQAIRTIQK